MSEEKNTEKRMGGGVGVGGWGRGGGTGGFNHIADLWPKLQLGLSSLPYDHDSVSTMIYPSDTLIRGSSYSKFLLWLIGI